MTSTLSRVAAGVPTGGQFAATGHAEPDLTLLAPPTGCDPDLADSLSAWNRARCDTDRHLPVATMKAVSSQLRANYPDARYLDVELSDLGPYMSAHSLHNADGQMLTEQVDDLDEKRIDGAGTSIGSALSFLTEGGAHWGDCTVEHDGLPDGVHRLDLDQVDQLPAPPRPDVLALGGSDHIAELRDTQREVLNSVMCEQDPATLRAYAQHLLALAQKKDRTR